MSNGKEEQALQEQLEQASGVISWAELARHFARGVVIKVDATLELAAVGVSFAKDNTEQVQQWLSQDLLARANDDDARDWTATEPQFHCLVAAPWVLVQIYPNSQSLH